MGGTSAVTEGTKSVTRGTKMAPRGPEAALSGSKPARRATPSAFVIPRRVVVTAASFDAVARLLETPRKPTRALRALLHGESVVGEP